MHDLLLTKKGIAAPATHPFRLAVNKHKARLNAELTKARLGRGFVTLEALRNHVESGVLTTSGYGSTENSLEEKRGNGGDIGAQLQPRWVRVNTLRTSLDEQLATTFCDHKVINSIDQILSATHEVSGVEKLLYIDKHIPSLLAISPNANISSVPAYRNGLIILQDKASCFPAYLLDPQPEDGWCLDACAAPGNKTTHLAALMQGRSGITEELKIWACERDKDRSLVLRHMIAIAGAEDVVEIKAPQDFLRLDHHKAPWDSVSLILLDPSCSGSGIIGREDTHSIVLPSKQARTLVKSGSKKRKRRTTSEHDPDLVDSKEETPITIENAEAFRKRLEALSAFQLKLILRAFEFPKARKITYSTCSIHAEENEHVVVKALASSVAKQRGWHLLRRAAQVSGMNEWDVRGSIEACKEILTRDDAADVNPAELAEACIRCEKGTMECTQGFFVVAFIRDSADEGHDHEEMPDWEGFDD